jgi:hypothetical protein
MPPILAQRSRALAFGLICGLAGAGRANCQSVSANRIATHQLGFSGTTVSIQEDYRNTKWPVAHRRLILRGPNGRVMTMILQDGGAGALTTLSLYKRQNENPDSRGHAIQGSFVLIGARECVTFDPLFLDIARCKTAPPCERDGRRAGLLYLGRFDWANGIDPPQGRFQYGWRFLPFERWKRGVVLSVATVCPRAAVADTHGERRAPVILRRGSGSCYCPRSSPRFEGAT